MDKLLFSGNYRIDCRSHRHHSSDLCKTSPHSTVSAFFHYFFVSIIILNVDIPHILWWLEGGVVGLALTIPMLIQVGHSDKKSLPIITFNAILLGTLVGLAGHYISVF
jgi:hypothetical protein